jgi:PhnB protein
MHVQPYLFFNGRCEEAIEFYKKTLGAKVEMLMRFSESPEKGNMPVQPNPNSIMHACFKIGDTAIMASDGCSDGTAAEFKGFSLSVSAKDEADARRVFAALIKTFFSPAFGMVQDKFGMGWMVVVEQAAAKAA